MALSTSSSRSFHYFWPRLWYSAQPLGTEARKAKKASKGMSSFSALDDVDSRIFIQGGPWIANHVGKLIAEDSVKWREMATCVLLMKDSKLAEEYWPAGQDYFDFLQGILKTTNKDGRCELKLARESSGDSESDHWTAEVEITSSDIWWCLPYWVAAEYSLHLEKIPVKEGFYFLVEAGNAFCIVTVNWNDFMLRQTVRIDGKRCSKSGWVLDDKEPLCVRMFETAGSNYHPEGRSFIFTQRSSVDRSDKSWQDSATLSGKVSTTFKEYSEESEEESDGEDGSEASGASDVEDSDPKNKSESENESESRSKSESENECKAETESESINESESKSWSKVGLSNDGKAVKADSKWMLHLSIAPAEGAKREEVWFAASGKVGKKLGTKEVYYRGPQWFDTIDLMLQEAAMRVSRLKKNAAIITGESTPQGATKDTPICVDSEETPAATSERPGPIRNSKCLRVSFHEGGRGTPVSHVVQVPKTHSIATFKANVKEALADEDVVGEAIRTSRLKWTFVERDGDKCEVDISPFTEAADLESSAALHVYGLSKPG